ncbi:hypothetical protein PENTCL1PPCAC_12560 [Pristionchus entomophagus]|uniref:G protein-coupled receptor n=1 Tax=Pristionchus entomophagus TaxID=358040 RepID=A0AAV5T5K6_9BILA|nr:hypothetical protein PENTCL1PPCAC_12560 [Pristionchus entomophagus]
MGYVDIAISLPDFFLNPMAIEIGEYSINCLSTALELIPLSIEVNEQVFSVIISALLKNVFHVVRYELGEIVVVCCSDRVILFAANPGFIFFLLFLIFCSTSYR